MADNKQLDDVIRNLNMLVHTHLPNIAYPFGDVISLAGKVAIEHAFKCIRIKWRPGRPPCGPEDKGFPGGGIQTFKELKPFNERYGFSRTEFGVLLSGSHGIKDAVLHVRSKEFPWVSRSSGVEYIKDSLNLKWWAKSSENLRLQSPMPHVFKSGEKIRLPVDLMFFPDAVKESKKITPVSTIEVEEAAYPQQKYLLSLITSDEVKFNNVFADVYSKMLEIGITENDNMGDWYVDTPDPHEEDPRKHCPRGWYKAKIANIKDEDIHKDDYNKNDHY
jgi:hypothetical protein